MYKTVLVSTDIEDGRQLLESLEQKLPVIAAFWFHFEDDDLWKLVFVSPIVAQRGAPHVYATLFVLLNNLDTERGRVTIPVDQVMVVSSSSQIYQTVKQHAGPIGGPVREGPVLDAYIYKMG
jgi:hypothetical protein